MFNPLFFCGGWPIVVLRGGVRQRRFRRPRGVQETFRCLTLDMVFVSGTETNPAKPLVGCSRVGVYRAPCFFRDSFTLGGHAALFLLGRTKDGSRNAAARGLKMLLIPFLHDILSSVA